MNHILNNQHICDIFTGSDNLYNTADLKSQHGNNTNNVILQNMTKLAAITSTNQIIMMI